MTEYVILVPIVVLFAIGAFITLQSGAGGLAASGRGGPDGTGLRLVAGNFSAMMLRVLGWVAVLAVLQGFVGFPALLFW